MHLEQGRGIEGGNDVAVEASEGSTDDVPTVAEGPTGSQRFVLGYDANIERCVNGVKVGLDLVNSVASCNHHFVHHVDRQAAHNVLQQRLVQHGKKRFWNACGPRSKT